MSKDQIAHGRSMMRTKEEVLNFRFHQFPGSCREEISSSMDEMANQANHIQQQCEQQQQDAQRLEELRENLKDATTPAYQILDDLENAKQSAGEMKKDVFYNTEAV